jgi:hypothetical protein
MYWLFESNARGIIPINNMSFLGILLIQSPARKEIAKITRKGVIEKRK